MKILYVLSSLLLVASSANIKRFCGCVPQYTPVCASNYETFPNECEMQCDPVHPNLFKLYNGPCITADSSVEARDQYATRYGLQFNDKDFLQATSIARETEDNGNSYYGAVANPIRLRQGNERVVSLKDRLPAKLQLLLEIESLKPKGKFAEIQDPIQQKLQREARRHSENQHSQYKDVVHQNYHREILNPDNESESKTSNQYVNDIYYHKDDQSEEDNKHLEYYNKVNPQIHQNSDLIGRQAEYEALQDHEHLEANDNEVNPQNHQNSDLIGKQAEYDSLQVKVEAQQVHDRADKTKRKVLKAQAYANKAQEEARAAEEKAHTLLNSDDKEDLETKVLQIQAQAHQLEKNARNAIKEARAVQVEARQVRERARQAAKDASKVKTVLQSRKTSQHIEPRKALIIAKNAQNKARRAEQKACKAKERPRNIKNKAL